MRKLLGKFRIKWLVLAGLLFLFGRIIGIGMGIPLLLILLYIFFFSTKLIKIKRFTLTNTAFLFLCGFSIGYLILRKTGNFCLVPITIIPMLTALLLNSPLAAFFLSLAGSISLAPLTGEPFKVFFIFIIASMSCILLVTGARRRTTIIRAGLISGALQSVSLLLLEHSRADINSLHYLELIINSLLSGIIVLGVLPVFEYLLQSVTNISLLELADTHQPLLQRLIIETPGTYHHSLVVGNLSETACNAVGANALLARVGAYYHDIGKLQKPEYFIENQDIRKNKHDNLSPTISKMIIMNHVKEGLELAKKYKLNPSLWDFIRQHHGNSLVYYFYRRALQDKEEDRQVAEEGFRYPGPKPDSKETAIVLLADSVEAATRAIKDPTPARIEELVHKIINNKFIDGQLDECDLTLKEIEKISQVFTKILSGIYHSRINYPQEQEK